MQATLIYNPNAGTTAKLHPDKLLEALRQAGYDPIYAPTLQEEDLDNALADAKDLVVVAGGDGSIRAAGETWADATVHLSPPETDSAHRGADQVRTNPKMLSAGPMVAGGRAQKQGGCLHWSAMIPWRMESHSEDSATILR